MIATVLPGAGGVDQLLDWSKTAPPRTQTHPGDKEGDFDDKVRGRALSHSILCMVWVLGFQVAHADAPDKEGDR